MKKTLPATLLIALCASTLNAAPDATALKGSVVHIMTNESDGTGFVIGADERTVFIVTAEHVVTDAAAGLHVQFYAAQHRSFAGRTFRRSDAVDLAIVLVDVAADDSIRRSLKPLAYRTGRVPMLTAVSNIAITDDQWFSNFEVNKLQTDDLNVFGFSKSGVTHGASGGPLFDDGYRLIGMVKEVDGVKASALKIDAILSLLSSWNVPVNLLEAWRPEEEVRASQVTFVYGGVFPGSEKKVEITIGGVTFRPTGNRYVATGVALGAVEYSVGGTMVVPNGQCNVTGNGKLTLEDGDVVEILWDRRTRAPCPILLRHQPSDLSRGARYQPPLAPAKIAITDEHGQSVAALVRVAQRLQSKGYATEAKLREESEKSGEYADMITVHMTLDVTVRGPGGTIAAAFVLTSRGGAFRQDASRTQALERLADAFEARLAQEVP